MGEAQVAVISAPVAIFPKSCAQDSQCFIQSNHPGFLLLIINIIFINKQNSGASSWYFHPTESPGALGLEVLPVFPLSGTVPPQKDLCWLWQGSGGQSPPPCMGCYVHMNVLTSIPTSRCSKRGLRTSCPRFEDLQCRSCLQHVNFSKCKCIKFLLNLGIVLYRALGRGRKLDHVLNEAPQTQVSLLQQVTEACRDF